MSEPENKISVHVWDRPVRVFHWLLVLTLLGSWVTGENGLMDQHLILGLTALALVLFRIIWGFVGGEHARFASFVKGPGAVLDYLKETRAGRHPTSLGHNPLGALAVLALLALVLVQASLGLFANDEILFEGPLYYLVEKDLSDTLSVLHHDLFHVLMIVVIIHVVAVLSYAVFFKEDLVRPMFTGKKQVSDSTATEAPKRRSALIALAIFAVCAALVWGLTKLG